MARKNCYFDATTWNDNETFIELDPTEKLLYLYVHENTHVSYCSIYKLSIRVAAFETGIDKDMVSKIFKRFVDADIIIIVDDYIGLKNYLTTQSYNKILKKVAKKEFEELPISVINAVIQNDQILNDIIEIIYDGHMSSQCEFQQSETMTPSCSNDEPIMPPSCGTSISQRQRQSISSESDLKTEREPLYDSRCQNFDYDQIRQIVANAGYPEAVAEIFYQLHEAVEWKVRGEPIKNIKAFLAAWLKNERTARVLNVDAIADEYARNTIINLKMHYEKLNNADAIISLFSYLPDDQKIQVSNDLINISKNLTEYEFYDFFRHFVLKYKKGA